MKSSSKTILTITLILISFFGMFLYSISMGSFQTSFSNIWDAVFHYDISNMMHFSIVHLRMPKITLAFLIGGSLAISGYLIQISINNPLAEPYILGTSSAASLGANLVFFGIIPVFILGIYMPPVVAFLLAILCTFVVVALAKSKTGTSGSKILLAGIAMSSLLTSLVAIMAFTADSTEKLRTIIFWVMGSFEHAKWNQILILSIIMVVVLIASLPFSKHLNLLLLGKEKARNLGLNSTLFHRIVLLLAILLASVSVTMAGAIGFVGLMIPHFVRALFGSTNKYNVIYSCMIGGLFLMLCELISKLVYQPVGLPIGIVTSIFGAPFFVYLLLKRNYKFE